MKKFAYIVEGRVNIILDEFNPDFPGIKLEERYAPEIIKNLVEIPTNVEVKEGMDYDKETKTFAEHIEIIDELNGEIGMENFVDIEEIEAEELPVVDGDVEEIKA